MNPTSLFPFILMVLVFIATALLFSHALPSYRSLIPQLLNKKGYSIELEGMRGFSRLA